MASIAKKQEHSQNNGNTDRKQKETVHSLKIRIAIMMTLAPALLTVSMAFISLNLYVTNSRSEHLRMAWGAARLTARAINGDM